MSKHLVKYFRLTVSDGRVDAPCVLWDLEDDVSREGSFLFTVAAGIYGSRYLAGGLPAG